MSKTPIQSGRAAEVDAFLNKVAAMPAVRAAGAGRLIFALDATQSRQPTWDQAMQIQGEMFAETAQIGGLEIQLVFFRGFGECKASSWAADGATLLQRMTSVRCRAGKTQIAKVLQHALDETAHAKVNALVFVGDAMEEPVDLLADLAGKLGLKGVPAFMFHEGDDSVAADAFREIARLSHGAYCRFDSGSARVLKDLLKAVAVYAAGGRKALADYSAKAGEAVRLLTRQMG